MAKTRKYGKSRKHHKRKGAKRSRSRKGSGMSRRQAGGKPVFVGAPFNGADTNTWGVTNHYAYNPEGSGSGDPLDIVLGTRNIKPGSMMGGKRRYRKKRATKKRRRKHKKRMRGGEISDDLNHPGNWLRNQIDRAIAGGSKKRRKTKKHSRKKRRGRKKTSKRRNRRMRGGYKGDLPFQNTVNLVRGVGNNLGNVVHGFRGFPEVASPYPTVQPGMDPPRMPIPVPADVETIYKTAQTNVGAIGSA